MSKKAFTLVELLVVISIIALLLSILMPSLSAARSQAKMIVCKSNTRQLNMANIGYAVENDGYYVPAASDMYQGGKNLNRWHGKRLTINDLFDVTKSPLCNYIGNGQVKECAEKIKFVKGQIWSTNFEQGCGGFGYNATYIGSRLWAGGISSMDAIKRAYERTTRIAEIKKPSETLMFADCAMAKLENGRTYIQEYSFAEAPIMLNNGIPMPSMGYLSPSIHFRHRGKADIVWVDGHVSSVKRIKYEGKNAYGVKSADFDIGWFGLLDNEPFDLD